MSVLSFLLVPAMVGLCQAHGAAYYPPSRQWICSGGATPNNGIGAWQGRGSKICEDLYKKYGGPLIKVVTDWSGVSRLPDGGSDKPTYQSDPRKPHIDAMGENAAICSAGNVDFDVLATASAYDLWRTGTTDIEAGTHTFVWMASAAHNTDYYDVYITKDGWDDKAPITWDSLERYPICHTLMNNQRSQEATFPCTIPKRKQGQHVIFQVWQRSDSPEAFYSCSDVRIGDVTSTVSTTSSAVSNTPSSSSTVSTTSSAASSTPSSSSTVSTTSSAASSTPSVSTTTSTASSTSTAASTATSSTTTSKSDPSTQRCANIWGQCGGKDYAGPTCCDEGLECVSEGEWYSHCRPSPSRQCSVQNEVCGGGSFSERRCCGSMKCEGTQWHKQCTDSGRRLSVSEEAFVNDVSFFV